MARCRLHQIRYVDQDDVAVVMKSRRSGSRLAIYSGNRYLKLQKCEVEILRTDEWIRWEKAVQNAMNCADCVPQTELIDGNSHTFTRRHVTGSSLRDVLKASRYSEEVKLSAIRWAVDSLCQLHRRSADWGSGVKQSVSHGDATVDNVIVNVDLQEASWIDFDMRHLPHVSELDRRADDLRALIFSAADCLPVFRFPRLVEAAIASLNDERLLTRLRDRLTNEWSQLNTFQLAQAPLSWTARNLLTELLLKQNTISRGTASVEHRCRLEQNAIGDIDATESTAFLAVDPSRLVELALAINFST
ncbi:MAG: hypothetical protein WCH39_25195 [Schlesneria sp.]